MSDKEEIADEEEFSLEQLGAAYAAVAAGGSTDHPKAPDPLAVARQHAAAETAAEPVDNVAEDWLTAVPATGREAEDASLATPEAIVEAALFVGHPENKPLTAIRLASLMRDVTPEEVASVVSQLNQSYREHGQGIRIVGDDVEGYRMTVAPDVESVRQLFSAKVRETRLNQPAIEVLALVAYQPGLTTAQLNDLRGRDSGPLLNQLVKRQLIEIRREPTDDGEKPVPRYHPTERLVVLLGLESIDDLPIVDETPL